MNLSIKNVPEQLVERLRQRAARSHRSLQGELLSIIEEAAGEGGRLTLTQVQQEARRLGVRTLPHSVDIIRADRDSR